MFDSEIIKSELFGVVGFQSSPNPEYDILSDEVQASSSGLYFQDIHPLCDIDIIREVQPYADITDDAFSDYLEEKIKSAAVKVCGNVFTESGILENSPLYCDIYKKDKLQENDNSFVGFEIRPIAQKNISVIINSVSLDFNADTTVKLLLFNSNIKTPVQTKTISVTSDANTLVSLNWRLPYSGTYAGGRWYVGYLNTGLGEAQAYNRDDAYKFFSHAIIDPVKIAAVTTESLWDYEYLNHGSYNYGLNFDISTVQDFTDIIVSNKNRFAQAIAYQFAANMLEQVMYTRRDNAIERDTKAQAALALNGNSGEIDGLSKSVGIIRRLNAEVQSLREWFVEDDVIMKGTLQ